MHMSADLYYAVELISVIKASRVITIEGKNQSPTVTSSTHNIDDPLPHPLLQLSSYILHISNKHLYMSYIMHTVHLRCMLSHTMSQ